MGLAKIFKEKEWSDSDSEVRHSKKEFVPSKLKKKKRVKTKDVTREPQDGKVSERSKNIKRNMSKATKAKVSNKSQKQKLMLQEAIEEVQKSPNAFQKPLKKSSRVAKKGQKMEVECADETMEVQEPGPSNVGKKSRSDSKGSRSQFKVSEHSKTIKKNRQKPMKLSIKIPKQKLMLQEAIDEVHELTQKMEVETATADETKSVQEPSLSSFAVKLRDELKGSRFRFLNEKLYTQSGRDAVKLFRGDTEAFKAYHEGYQHQVAQWPFNPLKRIIKAVRKMSKQFVIADFGCGEGQLAKSVTQKVYSFDLVSSDDHVTACDMANTPLFDKSIDVAIYCLSLMGTNLKDFLLEANRVLKVGGTLKIAEVASRFDKTKSFVSNVEKCGFKRLKEDLTPKLFYFFDFKKVRDVDKNCKSVNGFSLKPCLYKKR